MKQKLKLICTEKLMVITNQENRKRETTTGNLHQKITSLVMENKEFWMELQKLFVLRDTEKISQKQSSLKRSLKTSKVSPQIFLDNPRIQDKVKTQDQITFTEFQMSKATTHGTPPDAFTENQMPERYYLTKIWENQ